MCLPGSGTREHHLAIGPVNAVCQILLKNSQHVGMFDDKPIPVTLTGLVADF